MAEEEDPSNHTLSQDEVEDVEDGSSAEETNQNADADSSSPRKKRKRGKYQKTS